MAFYRRFIAILLAALFTVGAAAPVSAALPDYGYNYSYWGEAEPAPYPYLVEQEVFGKGLGIGDFNDPQDVFVSAGNQIVIADTGNNRIVVLDAKGQLVRVIDSFDNAGKQDTFNKPYGVFVDKNDFIYIADKQNARVVKLTIDGKLEQIFGPPVSSIIPKDFQYFPQKVAVDKTNRVYVVAQGAYEGIMEFDALGNFKGYVGTNKVRFNAADLLWKRLSTKEQNKQMQLFLPVEFGNLDLDERGFIYAVSSEVGSMTPIKKINPGGEDVLRREGYFYPIGDIAVVSLDAATANAQVENAGASTFIDVIYERDGLYSGLDSRRNRIFTYDRDGNLLYQFGGVGMTSNNFQKPTAMDMLGDKFVVMDGGMNRLMIFAPTRYGSLIRDAVISQFNGKVDAASEAWNEILKLNANYDIAYIGMGKALMKKDESGLAMDYFKNGNNRKYYSEAFKRYRSEYLWNHFATIVFVIVGLVAVYIGVRIYWKRRRPALHFVETGVLQTPFRTMIRPFSGFWEMKYEGKGRIWIALSIILLLVVTMILKRQYSGFVVNFNKLDELNSVDELKFIVLPFFLFCIANWSLTTLMDGEGKFKDIVMAMGYALLPLVVVFIPQILFSNLITSDEAAFYYLLESIAYLWFAWLMFIGTMTVHQYTIGKTVVTLALTAVVMAFIVFLGLLCFSLVQQMATFIESMYREIIVRM